jgi:Leucine-rich repeat (LRR) protein
VFSNLRALRYIDLRNNALEEINITAFDIPALKHIHLAGKQNFSKFLFKNCENLETFCQDVESLYKHINKGMIKIKK